MVVGRSGIARGYLDESRYVNRRRVHPLEPVRRQDTTAVR